ncbi:unnamed protein product [Mytilus edulis]|uniref:Uncharacterized protein n=1 Tax=Mytilus edulis TaxID=6550 RepID=A0A8S3US02_MYTED|nr:unnamed protein product [Mytilus edulis]
MHKFARSLQNRTSEQEVKKEPTEGQDDVLDLHDINYIDWTDIQVPRAQEPTVQVERDLPKSVTVNNTKIGQAVSNIGREKYSKGFRELWKQSKTAKRAAIHVLQDEIRNEVTQFAKTTSGETSLDDILGFNWNLILNKAAIVCSYH